MAATHVHHVYGADMNVHRVREVVGPDVPICLDAAQSVGHLPVDLAALDVDFAVFSGHKAMGLPGTGVVWARGRRGAPYRPGGWQGTPSTTGILSLRAALDWLDAAGVARIDEWTVGLGVRLTDGLSRLGSYEVLGCPLSLSAASSVQRRQGLVTFRHHGISANDLGFILAAHGLLVRADGLCQARAGEADSSVRSQPARLQHARGDRPAPRGAGGAWTRPDGTTEHQRQREHEGKMSERRPWWRTS